MWLWVSLLITINFACILAFAYFLRRGRNGDKLANLIAASNARVPMYSDTLPQIKAEISRARRYHRRLTIVVFRLARELPSEAVARGLDLSKQHVNEAKFLFLGALLRQELRTYDIVTFDPSCDQYVVLMVESNRLQSKECVDRISTLVNEKAGITLIAGYAEFPYSGLILEDLVAKAGEDTHVAETRRVEISAV